jgi:hypothetical protein
MIFNKFGKQAKLFACCSEDASLATNTVFVRPDWAVHYRGRDDSRHH